MPELKLGKLPDRVPVKITISVPPELNQALHQYAELYLIQFSQAEPIAELIPYMLTNFLESDRGFAKARKDGRVDMADLPADAPARRGHRNRMMVPPTVIGEV
jgi:hypothetical protein